MPIWPRALEGRQEIDHSPAGPPPESPAPFPDIIRPQLKCAVCRACGAPILNLWDVAGWRADGAEPGPPMPLIPVKPEGRGNGYISLTRDRVGGDWNVGDLPRRDLRSDDSCGTRCVLCGAVPLCTNDHRCDPRCDQERAHHHDDGRSGPVAHPGPEAEDLRAHAFPWLVTLRRHGSFCVLDQLVIELARPR